MATHELRQGNLCITLLDGGYAYNSKSFTLEVAAMANDKGRTWLMPFHANSGLPVNASQAEITAYIAASMDYIKKWCGTDFNIDVKRLAQSTARAAIRALDASREPEMVKVRIADLEGDALDAAMALLNGARWDNAQRLFVWSFLGIKDAFSQQAPNYSTDWGRGGPIIDRANIATERGGDGWQAAHMVLDAKSVRFNGPTKLAAGIKCFVAMNCKEDWIEIPAVFAGQSNKDQAHEPAKQAATKPLDLNNPLLEVLADIARTVGARRYFSGDDSRDDWHEMAAWAAEFQSKFESNPDAGETYNEDIEEFTITKAKESGWTVFESPQAPQERSVG